MPHPPWLRKEPKVRSQLAQEQTSRSKHLRWTMRLLRARTLLLERLATGNVRLLSPYSRR
jgi:hypothetical protein